MEIRRLGSGQARRDTVPAQVSRCEMVARVLGHSADLERSRRHAGARQLGTVHVVGEPKNAWSRRSRPRGSGPMRQTRHARRVHLPDWRKVDGVVLVTANSDGCALSGNACDPLRGRERCGRAIGSTARPTCRRRCGSAASDASVSWPSCVGLRRPRYSRDRARARAGSGNSAHAHEERKGEAWIAHNRACSGGGDALAVVSLKAWRLGLLQRAACSVASRTMRAGFLAIVRQA